MANSLRFVNEVVVPDTTCSKLVNGCKLEWILLGSGSIRRKDEGMSERCMRSWMREVCILAKDNSSLFGGAIGATRRSFKACVVGLRCYRICGAGKGAVLQSGGSGSRSGGTRQVMTFDVTVRKSCPDRWSRGEMVIRRHGACWSFERTRSGRLAGVET